MSADPIEPIGKVSGSGVAHEERLNWAGATGSATKSSSGQPPHDASQLSPLAQFVSTLERLRSSDPVKYADVTQKVAKILDGNAQTALSQGNSNTAAQLRQLSADFSTASKSGHLNGLLQDLSEAVSSGEQGVAHARSASGTTQSKLLAVIETSRSQSAKSTALDSIEILGATVSISETPTSKIPPI